MPSANFYNDAAKMMGVDLHHAQLPPTGVSELATGHRQDDWPYAVFFTHGWPGGDDGKRTPNVTADGQKMIRDGFVMHKFPHITVGLFHPYQAVENAKIISDSQSTPLLKAPTVTSNGDPLAVCSIASVGANLSCQDGGMKLTSIVASRCSVKTAPQMKDLLFRIFDDYLKQLLIKWLTRLFDLLLKARKIPPPFRQIFVWLFEKVIAKVVDWMEKLVSWLWDTAVEASKDPQQQPPELPPPPPELPEQPQDQPQPDDWQEQQRKRLEQEQKEAEERQRKRDQERQAEKNKPWWQWW